MLNKLKIKKETMMRKKQYWGTQSLSCHGVKKRVRCVVRATSTSHWPPAAWLGESTRHLRKGSCQVSY